MTSCCPSVYLRVSDFYSEETYQTVLNVLLFFLLRDDRAITAAREKQRDREETHRKREGVRGMQGAVCNKEVGTRQIVL